MKATKKIVGFLTAVALVMTSVTGFAQSKKEAELYYDFDEYEAESASVKTPDEHWSANAPSRFNYGSGYDEETASRTLKIRNGGEALLFFDEIFKTGKLHVSFDIKTGENCDMYIGLYNTRVTENVRDTTSGNATQHLSNMFHYDRNSINTFTGMGWGYDGQKIENVDNTEWTHIDCMIGELSNSATRTLSVYRNGAKVNQNPVSTGQAKAFKALYLRLQSGDDVYVDNVYVHRYYDDAESLGVISENSKTLDTENAEISLKFTEPVDSERLTADDVELIRQLDGYKVRTVEIIGADERTARLKVNETLQKGLYSLKINNLKAKYSGASWTKALSLRTKYEVKEVVGICYSENFDSYTAEENAWPDGWVTDVNNNKTNSAVESVQGASGLENDKAFGMNISNSVVRRAVYKLEQPIDINDVLEFSFDVKTSETDWGIYLLDKGTMDAGITADSRTDIVIGGTKGETALKYSNDKSSLTVTDGFDDECIISGGEWHNIKLSVNPSDEGGSEYTVSVDGGKEYSAKVSRDFTDKGIEAIGVGFKGTEQGGTIAFDNIILKSKTQAMCPEVDRIAISAYNGTEYTVSDTIPREVKKIDVIFNTKISAAVPGDFVKLVCTANAADVRAEYVLNDDKTAISIIPQEPLDSNKVYQINVSADVASYVTDEAKMGIDFTQSFKTEFESGDILNIYSKEFITNNNQISFEVKLGKTEKKAKKYTVAIAGFDFREVDGVTYEKMKEVAFEPVVLTENDVGFYTIGAKAKIAFNNYDKVKGFIFEYPSMKLISAEEMK